MKKSGSKLEKFQVQYNFSKIKSWNNILKYY